MWGKRTNTGSAKLAIGIVTILLTLIGISVFHFAGLDHIRTLINARDNSLIAESVLNPNQLEAVNTLVQQNMFGFDVSFSPEQGFAVISRPPRSRVSVATLDIPGTMLSAPAAGMLRTPRAVFDVAMPAPIDFESNITLVGYAMAK